MRFALARGVALAAPLLVVLSAPAPCRAETPSGPAPSGAVDPGAPETAAAPATGTRWYGWQPLAGDAAAVVLAGAAIGTGACCSPVHNTAVPGVFAWTALADYALAGPLLHVAHGRYAIAAADFFIRLGAPLIVAAIGYGMELALTPAPSGGDDESWFPRGTTGGVVGLLAGIAGAVVTDAAALSREPLTAAPPAPPKAAALPWRLVPVLTSGKPGERITGASIVGTF